MKRSIITVLLCAMAVLIVGSSVAQAVSAWQARVLEARVASSAPSAPSVPWDRLVLPAHSVPVVPQGPQGPHGAIGPMGPAGPGGNNAAQFLFKGDVNTPSTTVATFDGVKLLASCNGVGRVSLNAVALNVAPGILTERNGLNFQIVPRFGVANTTAAILLTPLSSASSRADVTVHYVSNAGQNTTINAAAVDLADGPNGLSQACIVYGRR